MRTFGHKAITPESPSLDNLNNFLSGQGFSLKQQWITHSFWGDAFSFK